MALLRKAKLDNSDEFARREREKIKDGYLVKDLSDDEEDNYTYEMALKKRSIAALLNKAIEDETGNKPKGIRWRKRKISEDE